MGAERGPGRPARRHRLTGLALVMAAATGAATAEPAPALLAACAACHGPGGNAVIAEHPSIAGQPKVFIENQLVLIREGLRDVPSMKAVVAGLDDAQIVALAVHYAAQPVAPRTAPVDARRAAQGAEVSRRMLCGTCHLPDYRGQDQVPRLAGQNEAYLYAVMKQFRDRPAPGRDTMMSVSLQGLGDAELAQLAHYLATAAR